MSWKRVLCLYPYAPDKKSEQLYGGMAIINPIGLEVVATAAARYAEVMVVDMRLEKEPLEKLLAEFRPEMVAVSLSWGRDDFVDDIMRRLPPEATVIAGGIHPTQHPEDYFAAYPGLDILVHGYGEKPMADLLAAGRPDQVKGLWYRRRGKAYPPEARAEMNSNLAAGEAVAGAAGGEVAASSAEIVRNDFCYEVDVTSFHVNRKLRRYSYPFLSLKGDNVATSIGCPMVCAFCGWRTNIYGASQKWFPRPAADVVDEIFETDAEVVHIVDANFAHDLRRVEEICDLLIARGSRKLLACEIRVNALSQSAALVKKMEQAGFFMFMVGIEATDDAVLKRLKKGYTVKMCREAFDHLRQTHIVTLGNFIIGSPGQSEADMLYIAQYARELGLDFISPNKLYAYPNSAFSEWIMENPGYRLEGRRQYVVSDKIDLQRLRQIQRKIYFRFFTPAQIWRFYRKALSHPMVLRIGRDKVRRGMLKTLLNHLADARFRRRLVKKLLGRFGSKRRQPKAATL